MKILYSPKLTSKPTPGATYERARRLANSAMWTVEVQCRRLQQNEPEDEFYFRQWADFQFLIVILWRLRRAALLITKIPEIGAAIRDAIKQFDNALPSLKTMRDVAEHIDDYATDDGRNEQISRTALEVMVFYGPEVEWLGMRLDIEIARAASGMLFEAIKINKPLPDPVLE